MRPARFGLARSRRGMRGVASNGLQSSRANKTATRQSDSPSQESIRGSRFVIGVLPARSSSGVAVGCRPWPAACAIDLGCRFVESRKLPLVRLCDVTHMRLLAGRCQACGQAHAHEQTESTRAAPTRVRIAALCIPSYRRCSHRRLMSLASKGKSRVRETGSAKADQARAEAFAPCVGVIVTASRYKRRSI